jgi:hypothetical protein
MQMTIRIATILLLVGLGFSTTTLALAAYRQMQTISCLESRP